MLGFKSKAKPPVKPSHVFQGTLKGRSCHDQFSPPPGLSKIKVEVESIGPEGAYISITYPVSFSDFHAISREASSQYPLVSRTARSGSGNDKETHYQYGPVKDPKDILELVRIFQKKIYAMRHIDTETIAAFKALEGEYPAEVCETCYNAMLL